MNRAQQMDYVVGHGARTHRGAVRDGNHAIKNKKRIVGMEQFKKLNANSKKSYDVRGIDDGSYSKIYRDIADAHYGFSPKKRTYKKKEAVAPKRAAPAAAAAPKAKRQRKVADRLAISSRYTAAGPRARKPVNRLGH